MRQCSIGDVNVETLEAMYRHCKSLDKLDFLKIDTSECPIDKKFSCNFCDYLNPKDFYVEKKSKNQKIKIQVKKDLKLILWMKKLKNLSFCHWMIY